MRLQSSALTKSSCLYILTADGGSEVKHNIGKKYLRLSIRDSTEEHEHELCDLQSVVGKATSPAA